MSDVVERLLKKTVAAGFERSVDPIDGHGVMELQRKPDPICQEAADEITRLRADNRRDAAEITLLRFENEKLSALVSLLSEKVVRLKLKLNATNEMGRLNAEIASLRAENERLREENLSYRIAHRHSDE